MMNLNRHYFVFFAVLFVMAACVSLPALDTLNKQIAAFEVSYGVALDKLNLYKAEGRFTESQKTKADEAVRRTEAALEAVYVAKAAGNIATAQGKLALANQGLGALREYLTHMEGK